MAHRSRCRSIFLFASALLALSQPVSAIEPKTHTILWFRPRAETGAGNFSRTIVEGDTVEWVWNDGATHDVSDVDYSNIIGSLPNVNGYRVTEGEEFSVNFTFTSPGTYMYKCTFHPGLMQGTIEVLERKVTETVVVPWYFPLTRNITTDGTPPEFTLTVQQGDSIMWVWCEYEQCAESGQRSQDLWRHAVNSPPVMSGDAPNVTLNESSYINWPEYDSTSMNMSGGAVNYTFTFNTPGVFDYNCWEHPEKMAGTITVVDFLPPHTPTPTNPPTSQPTSAPSAAPTPAPTPNLTSAPTPEATTVDNSVLPESEPDGGTMPMWMIGAIGGGGALVLCASACICVKVRRKRKANRNHSPEKWKSNYVEKHNLGHWEDEAIRKRRGSVGSNLSNNHHQGYDRDSSNHGGSLHGDSVHSGSNHGGSVHGGGSVHSGSNHSGGAGRLARPSMTNRSHNSQFERNGTHPSQYSNTTPYAQNMHHPVTASNASGPLYDNASVYSGNGTGYGDQAPSVQGESVHSGHSGNMTPMSIHVPPSSNHGPPSLRGTIQLPPSPGSPRLPRNNFAMGPNRTLPSPVAPSHSQAQPQPQRMSTQPVYGNGGANANGANGSMGYTPQAPPQANYGGKTPHPPPYPVGGGDGNTPRHSQYNGGGNQQYNGGGNQQFDDAEGYGDDVDPFVETPRAIQNRATRSLQAFR